MATVVVVKDRRVLLRKEKLLTFLLSRTEYVFEGLGMFVISFIPFSYALEVHGVHAVHPLRRIAYIATLAIISIAGVAIRKKMKKELFRVIEEESLDN